MSLRNLAVLPFIGAFLFLPTLGWSAEPKAAPDSTIAEVPDADSETESDWLRLTPPTKGALFDARFQPIGMIRTTFIYTLSDSFTTAGGDAVDTTEMPKNALGHRTGFILDHVETGMRGRFDDYGLFYKIKFDLMPRDATGNRSGHLLRDAFVGWNRYSVFDVRLGNFKAPMSQAKLTASNKWRLMETPLPASLALGYRVGVQVAGGDPWGIVRGKFGVFNSASKPADLLDGFDQLLYAGRLELRLHKLLSEVGVDVPKALNFKLQIAGSAAWTPESKAANNAEQRWLGGELKLDIWRFELEAEFLFRDSFPAAVAGATPADVNAWGWHVDLEFAVIPKVLDVIFRVADIDGSDLEHGLDPTFPTGDIALQAKRFVTVGVAGHFLDGFTCRAEYTHRQELEGLSYSNDIILGVCQYSL